MEINSFVVHGKDGRMAAILVLEKLQGITQSWIHHDRRTGLLVKSMLLLSVCLPHGRCDEEEYDIVVAAIMGVIGQATRRRKKIVVLAHVPTQLPWQCRVHPHGAFVLCDNAVYKLMEHNVGMILEH